MFVAEINDLLSVGHPAYDGAADTEALEQELEIVDCMRLQSSSYLDTDSLGGLEHSDNDH